MKAASALSIKLNEDLLHSNDHGRVHRDQDILKGRSDEESHTFSWQKAVFQTFYAILTPPVQAGNVWYAECVIVWLQVCQRSALHANLSPKSVTLFAFLCRCYPSRYQTPKNFSGTAACYQELQSCCHY
jgi:hypothetical protein